MKELRIGVVLYGGVSLAIYMNGITTELWHAIRASRLPPDELTGTEKLYRALLDEVAKESGTQIAIVVDTIAGTSAGGVNGAVLGHAIANGSDAAVLNRVWVEDAGIEKLRREADEPAPWWFRALVFVAGKVPVVQRKIAALGSGVSLPWMRDSTYAAIFGDGRATPLDGGYFARMIAGTLAAMRQPPSGPALLGNRNVLDLFLTQTDLYGWPRHLPVSVKYHPTPLFERTHAHCLQFRAGAGRADFNDEFALTYAARTTAGFPVAFASANTQDLAEAFKQGQPQTPSPDLAGFGRHHLSEHVLSGFDPDRAWMVDGGFLDNRPFSYVTEAIEGKAAEHEVTRAVIYVEPDPELRVGHPPDQPPGLFALAGRIFGLFRHEPILADLQRLTERNAKVQRIRDMLTAESERAAAIVRKLGARLPPPGTPLPSLSNLAGWATEVNRYLAGGDQTGYAGYVQLKARRAAETLAETICRALGYRWETRHAYLVRETVRRMMEAQGALAAPTFADDAYRIAPAQLALLDAFDIGYRVRRLRHIVRAVNALYARLNDEAIPAERRPGLRDILDGIKGALADVAEHYDEMVRNDLAVRETVLGIFGGDIAAVERNMERIGFDAGQALSEFGRALIAIQDELFPAFSAFAKNQNAGLEAALAAASQSLKEAGAPDDFDTALAQACVDFGLLDVAIFPMMDSAGVEDPIPIDVLRISPSDSDMWREREPLKSSALGAFKGFLDRGSREYDLAMGRLDGAERIVDLILTTAFGGAAERPQLRDNHRRALARAILSEEIAKPTMTPAIGQELLALQLKI